VNDQTPNLIAGDFFELVEKVPTESVDLAFVDPPYFLSTGGFTVSSGKSVPVDKGLWDRPSPSTPPHKFHEQWAKELRRVLKPHGAIVVSGTYHSIYDCGVAITGAGYKVLNEIIWFKPNGAPNLSRRRLAASHETLIWAAKSTDSQFTFNYNDMRDSKFPEDKIKRDGKQMRSVWWIPTASEREKVLGRHPTQKPLALVERILLAFSNPGDTILDPFMGSGTTGVAALRTNRNFVGFENNPEFFTLATNRIQQIGEK
jgi:site-specific DNA-methyltransferase (adenine-specific)